MQIGVAIDLAHHCILCITVQSLLKISDLCCCLFFFLSIVMDCDIAKTKEQYTLQILVEDVMVCAWPIDSKQFDACISIGGMIIFIKICSVKMNAMICIRVDIYIFPLNQSALANMNLSHFERCAFDGAPCTPFVVTVAKCFYLTQ